MNRLVQMWQMGFQLQNRRGEGPCHCSWLGKRKSPARGMEQSLLALRLLQQQQRPLLCWLKHMLLV
ncbi:MAG: hypothetical protein BM559_00070 [Roseobacter sp. MedPE-SWchi]|nr:MAG: hypothetical protein BM559_00070 [Roseobacter sp. MedPE-SWchi]